MIKKMSQRKKVLIIVLAPIVFIILLVIGVKIRDVILNKIDQDKFTTLDSNMRSIYKEIKTASNGAEDWKYSAVCSANHTGDWPTGDYDCVTTIYLEKEVSSMQDANTMHEKYYPIIKNNSLLLSSSSLVDKDVLGSRFIVAQLSGNFVNKRTEAKCSYFVGLSQVAGAEYIKSSPSEIISGKGKFMISFLCFSTARDSWYQLVPSTSSLKPEKFN